TEETTAEAATATTNFSSLRRRRPRLLLTFFTICASNSFACPLSEERETPGAEAYCISACIAIALPLPATPSPVFLFFDSFLFYFPHENCSVCDFLAASFLRNATRSSLFLTFG
ncbi:unnamed protein product, partial [Amoebophrya sp. A120]